MSISGKQLKENILRQHYNNKTFLVDLNEDIDITRIPRSFMNRLFADDDEFEILQYGNAVRIKIITSLHAK